MVQPISTVDTSSEKINKQDELDYRFENFVKDAERDLLVIRITRSLGYRELNKPVTSSFQAQYVLPYFDNKTQHCWERRIIRYRRRGTD